MNSFSRSTEQGNLLELHPTVKPVALVADAVMDCSNRNDIVLDPLLGSGTTIIAAERTGRRCHGMELDPGYVDTAIRRWQAFTGLLAMHGNSGRSFAQMEEEATMTSDERTDQTAVGRSATATPGIHTLQKGANGEPERPSQGCDQTRRFTGSTEVDL